jgi:hypothetical protein
VSRCRVDRLPTLSVRAKRSWERPPHGYAGVCALSPSRSSHPARPDDGSDRAGRSPAGRRGLAAHHPMSPAPLSIGHPMPASRKQRRLGRWSAETRVREAPLDEVPDGVRRISLPSDDTPESHRSIDADEATLALELQRLRRQLRRARWIPWRRRKRPQIGAAIDQLRARRRQLRADRGGQGRRH